MARTTTTIRPPWDLIEKACRYATLNGDKPTRKYIKKVLAEKYNYDVDSAIDRGLHLGVLDGIYEQKDGAYYISKPQDT